MSDKSAIEWTDATWNPVTGCTRVSPGCANCYIERTPPFRVEGRRFERVGTEETTGVRLHPDRLDQPLRWRKPRRVFVCSLADLFHEQVPDKFIRRVFAVMAGAPWHTFQVLTKRPERASEVLAQLDRITLFDAMVKERAGTASAAMGWWDGLDWPLPNVWLGVSIENARYTWRAHVLREIPAAVRFISAEPLLGSLIAGGIGDSQEERLAIYEQYGSDAGIHRDLNVNVGRSPLDLTGIDWVICGGESGGKQARPIHPEWARELRDACLAEAAAPDDWPDFGELPRPAFFFKQWGSWVPYEPDAQPLWKGQDGRVIDGHSFPAALSEGDLVSGVRVIENHGRLERRPVAWWAPNPTGPVYRYAGASPKAGGSLLDGREWKETPSDG